MSEGAVNSMSREKIRQLLMAVGSEPTEDTTQTEATEYNWHEPHYFNSGQLAKLKSFTEAAAEAMAQKYSRFCRCEFNVTVASTGQYYVHEFLGKLTESKQKDYYIPFGAGANVWTCWYTRTGGTQLGETVTRRFRIRKGAEWRLDPTGRISFVGPGIGAR